MNNKLWRNVGKQLLKHRLERRFTQEKTAALSNIPRGSLSRYESGRYIISFERLIRLIQVLRIPFTDLTYEGIINYKEYGYDKKSDIQSRGEPWPPSVTDFSR